MRDPSRIFPLCAEVANLWLMKLPDWRFMQLMVNFMSWLGRDPFYMDDDAFLAKFKEYVNAMFPEEADE